MINRLKLALDHIEYSALVEVALKELRNPTDQARYIVRQELVRRGLLPVQSQVSVTTEENAELLSDGQK